ncbi:MAG: hypothetical protein AB1714_31345 [Acidobacteriota bacterium]
MAVKRLKWMSVVVAAVLGLGTMMIGVRELLMPDMMQRYIEEARFDYGMVRQLGTYFLAWGVLVLIFCWYMRMRNLWFVVSLIVIIYGVLYMLVPDQSLGILKHVYAGPPVNYRIAAGVKIVLGALLVASIRLGD